MLCLCFFVAANLISTLFLIYLNHLTAIATSCCTTSNFGTSWRMCQTFTLACSCLMWATKTSLELKRLLQSPQVYPKPGRFFWSAEEFVFLNVEVEDLFSPLSWMLTFPSSFLLLLTRLLLLVLLERVGLVLRGRLMPKFGGPSVVFRVPWVAWKGSRLNYAQEIPKCTSGNMSTLLLLWLLIWSAWKLNTVSHRILRVNQNFEAQYQTKTHLDMI